MRGRSVAVSFSVLRNSLRIFADERCGANRSSRKRGVRLQSTRIATASCFRSKGLRGRDCENDVEILPEGLTHLGQLPLEGAASRFSSMVLQTVGCQAVS